MASTTSSSPTLSINLTSAQLYWLYLFLLIGDVVLAFVVKIVPTSYGVAGLGTLALAFSGTIAHDYSTAHAPGGVPTWVAYVVVTVVFAVLAAIGTFTADTFLTVASAASWLVIVLSGIVTVIAEDAGASAPQYVETIITTGLGGAVTFLMWYANNPTATVGAILATLIAIVISYAHVTTTSPAPATSAAAGTTA